MKAEEILNEQAKKYMLSWNQQEFKRTHPRLYKTIIESINVASSENKS